MKNPAPTTTLYRGSVISGAKPATIASFWRSVGSLFITDAVSTYTANEDLADAFASLDDDIDDGAVRVKIILTSAFGTDLGDEAVRVDGAIRVDDVTVTDTDVVVITGHHVTV